ncbi:MAG: response regulator [Bacteroidota bacterium]|nr:response regulator [Bacteroidota bacterium]
MQLPEPGLEKINNILLAEDDEDDFYIFNHAMLSLMGTTQILHTSNGIMLSSMIQSEIRLDVIFLDINMPYKNGITCLKEIRSNPAFNETRVVIYSTANHKKEIDHCYALGANFYLIKPTSFSLTKMQLRELLQNQYFKLNMQPCRDNFVLNYQDACEKEFQGKLVA